VASFLRSRKPAVSFTAARLANLADYRKISDVRNHCSREHQLIGASLPGDSRGRPSSPTTPTGPWREGLAAAGDEQAAVQPLAGTAGTAGIEVHRSQVRQILLAAGVR